ncbi:MFS transporter [Dactylosporangium sp. CA-139066]|uniref:MFS transporter n=1 Tax=Dactylosporangium sp. CA-139066 TaxID=3239930 RepID=UPI003D8C7F97
MQTTGWTPRLWALVLVLSGNMLIDALEVSTSVVALPSVAGEFRLSPGASGAVMIAFALGFGGSIVAGGHLIARFGRRPAYLWAMVAFVLASFAGGLAPDLPTLLATRVVKGICVALTAPTGLAIIAAVFREGPGRARAVAVYSLFAASGFSAGLVLAGLLTEVSWRWALACSGPVALILLAFAARLIPPDGPSLAAASRAVPAAFPPSLWRSAAGGAILNGTFWTFLLVVTFQAQTVQGWSPARTGLALLPSSLPVVFCTPYATRLLGRFGPGPLIAAGSAAACAGYAWYFVAGGRAGFGTALLPAAVLVGVAFAASFAALNAQAMAQCPPGAQQRFGGVFQTAVQVGGATMLVLAALVTGARFASTLTLILAVAVAGFSVALAGVLVSKEKGTKQWSSNL